MNKTLLGILALVGFTFCSFSMAGQGPYFGLGYGDTELGDTIPPYEDESDGIKLFFGYKSKYIGAEFGYTELGEYTATVGSWGSEIDVRGYNATVVGYLPVDTEERFNLMGKVGVTHWEGDWTFSSGGVTYFDEDDSGDELLAGVGVQYDIGTAGGLWSVRAEWERYFDIGKSYTYESDIDVLSISLILTNPIK